jgi:Rod binding domain-containing protein
MTGIAALDLAASLNAVGKAQTTQAQAALKSKEKTKAAARDFEAMFLDSMFQQMFTGINGEGPFGGNGALRVWRSFLTDQYAKSFARAGGIGIAAHVYDALLKQQGANAS